MDKPATQRIYLDHQATTPLDPRVLAAMMPWLTDQFGNPHSLDHPFGWEAARALETARGQVAGLIGARPGQIVFLSGATEANNLAILGTPPGARPHPGHAITCATEHPSVLGPMRQLARSGVEVTVLGVDRGGRVRPDEVRGALRRDTRLVSVMLVNNEIGVIQPAAEIGALCREHGVAYHIDATQAAGRLALDVDAMRADLLSLSAHKIHGPMGAGALYVRREGVDLAARTHGGGQEFGLRAGTQPVALCVGFGVACALADAQREAEQTRLECLRGRLLAGIRGGIDGLRVNGDLRHRIAANLNVSIEGIDAGELLDETASLAMSTGAACASARQEPSHVLTALGLSAARIHGSIRIGLGRGTTVAEIDRAVTEIVNAVRRLRTR